MKRITETLLTIFICIIALIFTWLDLLITWIVNKIGKR
jgi:preprotein translocase subunit SecE